MSVNREYLQTWIQETMNKEGVKNYKVDNIGSSSKGEGYAADISFVKIISILDTGKEKIYDFAIKSGKDNDLLRANSPVSELYQREIQMYAEVFPVIEELQEAYKSNNPFKNYAKCYYTSKLDKKEVLVFQNLKTEGFILRDRSKHHDLEHVLLAFRTYAKWHGSSLALKIKKPDSFKRLTKNLNDLFGEFLFTSKMGHSFIVYFENGLDILRKYKKEEAAKKIQEEMGDVQKVLSKMTLSHDFEAETEAVIIHGDCWNTNMMFKYSGINALIPTDMALLDFQVTRLASPIFDLSMYLYAAADKEALDNFDYILREYYSTLRNYLQDYDINVETILTFDRLKSSWRKYGRYGLGICAFAVRTELLQEDEVVDYQKEIGEGTLGDDKVTKIAKQEEYEKRVHDVFAHYAETFL